MTIGVIAVTVMAAFSIAFPFQFSDGFEYSPLPITSMKSIPSQSDFLNKDQEALLGDTIHSTIIRDNGEKTEIYLLSEGITAGDSVGIFYFERPELIQAA